MCERTDTGQSELFQKYRAKWNNLSDVVFLKTDGGHWLEIDNDETAIDLLGLLYDVTVNFTRFYTDEVKYSNL